MSTTSYVVCQRCDERIVIGGDYSIDHECTIVQHDPRVITGAQINFFALCWKCGRGNLWKGGTERLVCVSCSEPRTCSKGHDAWVEIKQGTQKICWTCGEVGQKENKP